MKGRLQLKIGITVIDNDMMNIGNILITHTFNALTKPFWFGFEGRCDYKYLVHQLGFQRQMLIDAVTMLIESLCSR